MDRKKVNWMGHISRENCLLEDVTEEKIKDKEWRGDEDEGVSSYKVILRNVREESVVNQHN